MELPINIYGFVRDSSLVMLAWFFIAISFFIWGRFLSRILNIKISGEKGLIANIWLGFTFCIFFFSVYHLFFPIDAKISILFYIPSILVFIIRYTGKIRKLLKSIGLLKISAIFLTLFALATVAIQFPTHLDTGLYHLNSIRWANEYHIIKGIGNLHDRLGFNQLFFIYSASLNFHPWFNDYAFHLSNSFLCALFFVGMLLNKCFIDLAILCLFFFIPMPFHWISTPSPDIASTVIQIVIFRYFIEAVYYKVNDKNRSSYIAFAAILSTISITLKLSNIIFAFCLGVITIIFNYKFSLEKTEKKNISKAFIFIGILFFIWIIRGYIQTGYPFFPSTIGKMNFAWTVPEKIAKNQKDYIYTSACNVEINDINAPIFKNYSWVKRWFKLNFFDIDVFEEDTKGNINLFITFLLFPSTLNNFGVGTITLSIISVILILIFMIKASKNTDLFNKTCFLLYLLISSIVYIIFWFFSAPDPRFLNGIIIIDFIICLLLLKESFPEIYVKNNIKKALLFYPFIMFICNFNSFFNSKEFYISQIFILPKYKMQDFITDSGLKILKPIKADYNIWDSDLPASPHPTKSLSMIGKTILEGFCIYDR